MIMKKIMKIAFIVFIIQILFSALFADTNFRVMSYNALKFPSEDGANRLDDFGAIFEAVTPDIILMQEMESVNGANMMLIELNTTSITYAKSDFIDGFDTDNILFYNNAIVDLIDQNEIETPRREISEYIVQIDEGIRVEFKE